MAVVTGAVPAEKPPSFRRAMMVQGDASAWRFLEWRPWSAPIAKLPNN